ncbi:hypothetical protein J3E72DRAFT_431096 [Bipolaris maydis]|nr:hypothetical protein J3E72DRAFT_431096 [Bipolaris maydis]
MDRRSSSPLRVMAIPGRMEADVLSAFCFARHDPKGLWAAAASSLDGDQHEADRLADNGLFRALGDSVPWAPLHMATLLVATRSAALPSHQQSCRAQSLSEPDGRAQLRRAVFSRTVICLVFHWALLSLAFVCASGHKGIPWCPEIKVCSLIRYIKCGLT